MSKVKQVAQDHCMSHRSSSAGAPCLWAEKACNQNVGFGITSGMSQNPNISTILVMQDGGHTAAGLHIHIGCAGKVDGCIVGQSDEVDITHARGCDGGISNGPIGYHRSQPAMIAPHGDL